MESGRGFTRTEEFGSIFGSIPHHVQDWRNLKRGASSGVLTGWRLEEILAGRTTSTGGKVWSHRAGLEVYGFRNRGEGRDIEANSNQASNLKTND